MIIKFVKIHPQATIPTKAHKEDAGFDLTATIRSTTERYYMYGTGIKVGIPAGFVGLLFPRSSISNKNLLMANSVGVIDAGFTGEVMVKFKRDVGSIPYSLGDKIAQLVIMPIPQIEFIETEELEETDRGEGSFGSSGA